jgi:hypothetical protein
MRNPLSSYQPQLNLSHYNYPIWAKTNRSSLDTTPQLCLLQLLVTAFVPRHRMKNSKEARNLLSAARGWLKKYQESNASQLNYRAKVSLSSSCACTLLAAMTRS